MIKMKDLLTEESQLDEAATITPEEIYKLYMELYNLGHKIAAAKKRGVQHPTLWAEVLDNLKKPKSFLDKIQGSKSHLSKLTEEQVLSIRSKYEKMKVDYGRTRSCESLAKEYGLGSRTTIFRIVDKITWNHI